MAELATSPFLANDVEVHPTRNIIVRKGVETKLEPRVMDVLRYFAAHAGEVQTRNDLIDALWGVEFGGDESLTRAVSRLRQALKQIGADPGMVETVPKRGYLFSAAISELPAPASPPTPETLEAQRSSPAEAAPEATAAEPAPPRAAEAASSASDSAPGNVIAQFFSNAQSLRRRRVVRAALIYAAFSVAIFSLLEAASGPFGIDEGAQRIILIAVLSMFPMFLLGSWFIDMAPHLRGEGAAREDTPAQRRMDVAIIAAVAVGVALAVVRLATLSAGEGGDDVAAGLAAQDAISFRDIPSNSVAVLPFDCAPDETSAEFCRSIAFETVNLLWSVNGLRVNSSTGSLREEFLNRDTREIASILGVAHLVTGSVRRSGDQARIVATLVDARSDRIVASTAVSASLRNELDAQEALANAVLEGLGFERRVGAPERVEALSEVEIAGRPALDLFIDARAQLAQRDALSVAQALRTLNALVERFPDLADIRASLALAHLLDADSQYGETPVAQAAELARPHIDRALELAPDLPEAAAADGLAALLERRWDTAQARLAVATELLPGRGEYWSWLALARDGAGDVIGARRALTRAIELDPLSPVVMSAYVEAFAEADPDAARAAAQRYARARPDDPVNIRARASLALGEGDLVAAHDALSALSAQSAELAELEAERLGWIYWRLGMTASAGEAWSGFADLQQIQALADYRLGRCDDAFDWADSQIFLRSGARIRILAASFAACAEDWEGVRRVLGPIADDISAAPEYLLRLHPEAPGLPAALLAVAARETGQSATAELQALNGLLDHLLALRGEGLVSERDVALAAAHYAAGSGEGEGAAIAFARAFDEGRREPPEIEPALAPWRDIEAAQALIENFNALIAEQRLRVTGASPDEQARPVDD